MKFAVIREKYKNIEIIIISCMWSFPQGSNIDTYKKNQRAR